MEISKKIEEKVADYGKLDEEFNNFMHRVNEVDSIVKKLASNDTELQKQGDDEAKRYLGDDKERILENVEVDSVVLRISANRTVLNKKALMRKDTANSDEISKDAFMEEISKDADKRYKDRLVRAEKMETFKKQAMLAFRRGEYERALVLYNKAIEQVKDSILLYNNRGLTYIKLGLYDKAKKDLREWALRINEDCLKTWLLLAKVHFLCEEIEDFNECVLEAKKRNPERIEFISDYVKELQAESMIQKVEALT